MGGLECVERWWSDWKLDTAVWNAMSRSKGAGIVLRVPDDAAGAQCLAVNAVDDVEELLGPGNGDDAAKRRQPLVRDSHDCRSQ